jgi:hypothetical protein
MGGIGSAGCGTDGLRDDRGDNSGALRGTERIGACSGSTNDVGHAFR